jgi:hypothetical protein
MGMLSFIKHWDKRRASPGILAAYEGFLGILTNEASRKCLEDLDSDSYDDETFDHARKLSHDFRDGLMDLFFDQKSEMLELTRNYGVF